MIVIAGAVIGAFIGDRRARARGGNAADRAQYAVVYGIVLGLVGLFVTLILDRNL